MNIREFHISVSQETQNIASNTRRKFLPDEIDWMLNKNQERFVASRIHPKQNAGGFEVDEAQADSIRTLYVTRELPANLDGSDYSVPFPGDYGWLTSDDSKVFRLCTGDSVQASAETENVLVVPLPTSTKESQPYYSATTITLGSDATTISTIASQAETAFSGTRSTQEKYLIRDAFLRYYHQLGVDVSWERYDTIYKPGCFLFPGKTSGSISVDGTDTQGYLVPLTRNRYPDVGAWTPNRLTKGTISSTLQVTPFWKSDYRSPLSGLGAFTLKVVGDPSFIVSKVRLDYVRKPGRMSLSLGLTSELPETSHPALCDLTVEYIKALTADPNWEVKLKDNMLRSPLT